MSDNGSLEMIVGELKGTVDQMTGAISHHMRTEEAHQDKVFKMLEAHTEATSASFDRVHSRIDDVSNQQRKIVETQNEFRVDVGIIKGTTETIDAARKKRREYMRWAIGMFAATGTIIIAWWSFFKDHVMGLFR